MKWFARGKLWESPEAERAAQQKPTFTEKRGRDWRPGGQHKDPRARFDHRKRADHPLPRDRKPGSEEVPATPKSAFPPALARTPGGPRRDSPTSLGKGDGGPPIRRRQSNVESAKASAEAEASSQRRDRQGREGGKSGDSKSAWTPSATRHVPSKSYGAKRARPAAGARPTPGGGPASGGRPLPKGPPLLGDRPLPSGRPTPGGRPLPGGGSRPFRSGPPRQRRDRRK